LILTTSWFWTTRILVSLCFEMIGGIGLTCHAACRSLIHQSCSFARFLWSGKRFLDCKYLASISTSSSKWLFRPIEEILILGFDWGPLLFTYSNVFTLRLTRLLLQVQGRKFFFFARVNPSFRFKAAIWFYGLLLLRLSFCIVVWSLFDWGFRFKIPKGDLIGQLVQSRVTLNSSISQFNILWTCVVIQEPLPLAG
jgi:hypothetical protein